MSNYSNDSIHVWNQKRQRETADHRMLADFFIAFAFSAGLLQLVCNEREALLFVERRPEYLRSLNLSLKIYRMDSDDFMNIKSFCLSIGFLSTMKIGFLH